MRICFCQRRSERDEGVAAVDCQASRAGFLRYVPFRCWWKPVSVSITVDIYCDLVRVFFHR